MDVTFQFDIIVKQITYAGVPATGKVRSEKFNRILFRNTPQSKRQEINAQESIPYPTLANLVKLLRHVYSVGEKLSAFLYYEDNEQDLIRLSSEKEWREVVKDALKVILVDKEKNAEVRLLFSPKHHYKVSHHGQVHFSEYDFTKAVMIVDKNYVQTPRAPLQSATEDVMTTVESNEEEKVNCVEDKKEPEGACELQDATICEANPPEETVKVKDKRCDDSTNGDQMPQVGDVSQQVVNVIDNENASGKDETCSSSQQQQTQDNQLNGDNDALASPATETDVDCTANGDVATENKDTQIDATECCTSETQTVVGVSCNDNVEIDDRKKLIEYVRSRIPQLVDEYLGTGASASFVTARDQETREVFEMDVENENHKQDDSQLEDLAQGPSAESNKIDDNTLVAATNDYIQLDDETESGEKTIQDVNNTLSLTSHMLEIETTKKQMEKREHYVGFLFHENISAEIVVIPGTAVHKMWFVTNAGSTTWPSNAYLTLGNLVGVFQIQNSSVPPLAPGEVGAISTCIMTPHKCGVYNVNFVIKCDDLNTFVTNSDLLCSVNVISDAFAFAKSNMIESCSTVSENPQEAGVQCSIVEENDFDGEDISMCDEETAIDESFESDDEDGDFIRIPDCFDLEKVPALHCSGIGSKTINQFQTGAHCALADKKDTCSILDHWSEVECENEGFGNDNEGMKSDFDTLTTVLDKKDEKDVNGKEMDKTVEVDQGETTLNGDHTSLLANGDAHYDSDAESNTEVVATEPQSSPLNLFGERPVLNGNKILTTASEEKALLDRLAKLGFADREKNRKLLFQNGYDIQAVVQELLADFHPLRE